MKKVIVIAMLAGALSCTKEENKYCWECEGSGGWSQQACDLTKGEFNNFWTNYLGNSQESLSHCRIQK